MSVQLYDVEVANWEPRRKTVDVLSWIVVASNPKEAIDLLSAEYGHHLSEGATFWVESTDEVVIKRGHSSRPTKVQREIERMRGIR